LTHARSTSTPPTQTPLPMQSDSAVQWIPAFEPPTQVPPSSHSSVGGSTIPSPHTAGGKVGVTVGVAVIVGVEVIVGVSVGGDVLVGVPVIEGVCDGPGVGVSVGGAVSVGVSTGIFVGPAVVGVGNTVPLWVTHRSLRY